MTEYVKKYATGHTVSGRGQFRHFHRVWDCLMYSDEIGMGYNLVATWTMRAITHLKLPTISKPTAKVTFLKQRSHCLMFNAASFTK